MSAKREGDRLLGTTWVHVFEEDTEEGAIYRPEEDDIPLSRRARERFELRADGSARVLEPGPDDRFVEHAATWSEEKGAVVIRKRAGAPSFRIIRQSPSRLVVRTEAEGET
jgi:hypothetical protein